VKGNIQVVKKKNTNKKQIKNIIEKMVKKSRLRGKK